MPRLPQDRLGTKKIVYKKLPILCYFIENTISLQFPRRHVGHHATVAAQAKLDQAWRRRLRMQLADILSSPRWNERTLLLLPLQLLGQVRSGQVATISS